MAEVVSIPSANTSQSNFNTLLKDVVDSFCEQEKKNAVKWTKNVLRGEYIKVTENSLVDIFDLLRQHGRVSERDTNALEFYAEKFCKEKQMKVSIFKKVNTFKGENYVTQQDAASTTHFVGRNEDVCQILHRLREQPHPDIKNLSISGINLHGEGGVGKTRLAEEIAKQICKDGDCESIVVNLKDIKVMERAYVQMLWMLHQPVYQASKTNSLSRIYESIGNLKHDLLLVFDNIEDVLMELKEFKSFLTSVVQNDKQRRLKVLLTSRLMLNGVAQLSNYLVRPFTQDASKTLLLQKTDVDINNALVKQISESCCNKPFLLKGIAAILKEKLAGGEEVVARIEMHIAEASSKKANKADEKAKHPKDNQDGIKQQATEGSGNERAVLQEMFSELSELHKDFLIKLSIFARDFPIAVVQQIFNFSAKELLFHLNTLISKGLVESRTQEGVKMFCLHPLMQEFLKELRNIPRYHALYQESREVFCKHYFEKLKDLVQRFDKDCIPVFNDFDKDHLMFEQLLDLSPEKEFLTFFQEERELYLFSCLLEPLLSVQLRQALFHGLAEAADKEGNWLYAVHLKCWEALQVNQIQGGKRAREVLAKAKSFLSRTSKKKSEKYEEAKGMYLYAKGKSYYISSHSGDKDKDHHCRKALKCLEESLELTKRIYGRHTATARCLNAIGNCYNSLGILERASSYFAKAYKMRKELSGSNHHCDMPVYLNQFAVIHEKTGAKLLEQKKIEEGKKELNKAIEFYQEALDLEVKLKIDGYSNTAKYKRNMANAYLHLDEPDKAWKPASEAYEIRKRVLGLTHPDTVWSVFQLGNVKYWGKDYPAALKYFYEADEMEDSLPEGHHSAVRELIKERIKRAEDALDGMLKTKEKLIGAKGGHLCLKNVRVGIAAGSLKEPTRIRLTKNDSADFCDAVVRAGLTNDVILADSVLKLEPHGQPFSRDVTVEVSMQNEKPKTHSLEVFHGTWNPKGLVQWEHLSKDRCSFKKDDRTVTIRLSHFSLISCVYWCKVAVLQPSKAASYYFNVWPFPFHIGIYLKRDFPNTSFLTLRVVLISSTIYQEKRLRDECSSVQKCKHQGFQELCFQQCTSVWDSQDVEISLLLDGDRKKVESRRLKVDSAEWWRDGEMVDYELRQKEDVTFLEGKFEIKPEGQERVPVCFQEGLCPLVKKCLGIQNGYICNLKPVAEKLGLDEEEIKDVLLKNQSDQSCLEQMLSKWKKGQHHDRLGQLTSLIKEIPKEAHEVSDRGCMHIEHLRNLEKEVSDITSQTDPMIAGQIQQRTLQLFDHVFQDCCVEALDSEEGVEKSLDSKEYLANLSAFKVKLVDPSLVRQHKELKQKSSASGLLAIFPMLIQLVKEIFCKFPSAMELTGVWGLPKEDADQFDCQIKDAAQHVERGPLIAVLSNVLAKVKKLPHNKGETSDTQIEKWRKRVNIEELVKVLEHPVFVKLRRRIMMIAETLNEEMSHGNSVDRDISVASCRNVAIQLVDQLKFRPHSVVQFSFLDDQLGMQPKGDVKFLAEAKVFSQEFHINRDDCGEVSLHASASVCERGCVRKLGRLTIGFSVTKDEAKKIKVWRQSSLSSRRTLLTQLPSGGSFTVSLFGNDEKELQGYLDEFAGVIKKDLYSKDVSEIKSVVLTLRSISVKDGSLEGEAAQSLSIELLYNYPSPSINFRSRDFEEVCEAKAQELVNENLSFAKTLSQDVLSHMKTVPVNTASPFHYQALANRSSGVPPKLLEKYGEVLVFNQVQYNTVVQESSLAAIGDNSKIVMHCDPGDDEKQCETTLAEQATVSNGQDASEDFS